MSTHLKFNKRITWAEHAWMTVVLAALSLLPLLHGGFMNVMIYDRALARELWRGISCHWAHWNGNHLFWSAGTFLVLGARCERAHRQQFLYCLVLSALAIPIALWRYMPELATYGGLSGLDSALFALLAVQVLRDKWNQGDRYWLAVGVLCALAFAAKVGYEFHTAQTLFAEPTTAMSPVPLAHLVGGSVGTLVGIAPLKLKSLISNHRKSRWYEEAP
jgi:rhomboid family GlyGly-CTERM serine protease